MREIKDRVVSELDFFEFHEELVNSGARILRCTQISGGEEGRRYSLIWMV